jgi:anti-anti-sigma factor
LGSTEGNRVTAQGLRTNDVPHQPDPATHNRVNVETTLADRLRALVKVSGELDVSTAAPLWAVLRGHVDSGRRFLRLDMSGVTFLDATALTGITTVHRDLLQRRGTLVITGARSLVARVLRVTGLDEVLFVSGPRADDDHTLPFGSTG